MIKITLLGLSLILGAQVAQAETSCQAICVTLSKNVSDFTGKYKVYEARYLNGVSAADLVVQCQGASGVSKKALVTEMTTIRIPMGRFDSKAGYLDTYVEATAHNACVSKNAPSLLAIK